MLCVYYGWCWVSLFYYRGYRPDHGFLLYQASYFLSCLYLISEAAVHGAVTHPLRQATGNQKTPSMKKFVKKNWIILTGLVAGAIAGYLHWHFVGCNSGSCTITSSPYNSTLYGAVTGALFFSLFQHNKKKQDDI